MELGYELHGARIQLRLGCLGLRLWEWGHEVNNESRSGNLPIEDPEREKSNVHPLLYMSALYHSACFFPSLNSKPVSSGAGGFRVHR